MKKALIVLLILAVAGGLFAQSWSGSVSTGAKITFSDDIPVMATADGDDNGAVKASLSFDNSGDDWGVKVGASAKVATDGTGPSGLSIGDFNGWVKFADIFKLTAGKGIGDAWATGGNTDAKIGAKTDAAYRLEITPIDGLNFGFRFAYPKGSGVDTAKIANFFQETGIGLKYGADSWDAAAGLDLSSEETNGKGLDGNAYFGFNFTGIDIVTIHAGAKITNLFGTAGDMSVKLFEKLSGSIASLDWGLAFNEGVTPSPVTAGLDAELSYGIPINDKAKATVGADASLTILEKFSFDEWDIWASLEYTFNDKVSTKFLFEVDGVVDPSEITPFLRWTIKYSF
jgi:hypothetical protein